jgi:hypothetical protein
VLWGQCEPECLLGKSASSGKLAFGHGEEEDAKLGAEQECESPSLHVECESLCC